jgi:hypothetical protein
MLLKFAQTNIQLHNILNLLLQQLAHDSFYLGSLRLRLPFESVTCVAVVRKAADKTFFNPWE